METIWKIAIVAGMVSVGGEREGESGSDECVEKWRRGIATTAQNGVCRGGDAATRHTGYAESYIGKASVRGVRGVRGGVGCAEKRYKATCQNENRTERRGVESAFRDRVL